MVTEIISLSVDKEDLKYLKGQGISRSEFFRQAVHEFKRGEWLFDRGKQYDQTDRDMSKKETPEELIVMSEGGTVIREDLPEE